MGFGPMVGRLICAWFRIVSFKGTGEWSGPAGANGLAEIAREAATRVVRALTTGISDAGGKQRGLIGETRASAGMLLRTERDAAIPVDRSARALIGNDEVYGGRREDTYTEWFRELHERGVDTDQVMSDLGKLWDYLRHDPKWEIEEPEAANTGQNAAFSVRMLADHGCDTSLIGVCTPFHARRVWATVMKQGFADVNGKRVSVDHVAMATADVSLENYMKYGNRPDADTAPHPKSIVAVTMGEIKRLDEYPDEGHIVRQDIPGEVRDAYNRFGEIFRPAERRYRPPTAHAHGCRSRINRRDGRPFSSVPLPPCGRSSACSLVSSPGGEDRFRGGSAVRCGFGCRPARSGGGREGGDQDGRVPPMRFPHLHR